MAKGKENKGKEQTAPAPTVEETEKVLEAQEKEESQDTQKAPNSDEIQEVEVKETSTESVKTETEVVKAAVVKNVAEVKVEKAPVKLQQIRTLEAVDCLIGGKKYKFEKDITATVPTDVAAVLTFARQAYRL